MHLEPTPNTDSIRNMLFSIKPPELSATWDRFIMAYLGNRKHMTATLLKVDHARKLFGIWLFCVNSSLDPTFYIDTNPCEPVFKRTVSYPKLDNLEITGHFLWFSFDSSFSSFKILVDDKIIPIHFIINNTESPELTATDLQPPGKPLTKRLLKHRIVAALARISFIKEYFNDCWLLADRDYMADDNAEHLYRWIKNNHPEQKIFFALDKKSPDWARLKKENFNLINLHGLQYVFAFIYAQWVISSNVTGYISRNGWRSLYADLVKSQFCFLQHGVTKDYQPGLNIRWCDMLITATPPEFRAFAHGPTYEYIYSEREVRLTGFPRHDELLRKCSAISSPKTILVMPTWRKSLVNELTPGTGRRRHSESFSQSNFFLQWKAALQALSLLNDGYNNNFQVLLYPHPYLRQQMKNFNLAGVQIVEDSAVSIQDILADTALLITDYSSIAMEFALVKRPVLYFQFDREEFFGGGHSYLKGYFDYDKNGFGEVALTAESLVALARDYINTGCSVKNIYQKRMNNFFAFSDQENCKRVYDALLQN